MPDRNTIPDNWYNPLLYEKVNREEEEYEPELEEEIEEEE